MKADYPAMKNTGTESKIWSKWTVVNYEIAVAIAVQQAVQQAVQKGPPNSRPVRRIRYGFPFPPVLLLKSWDSFFLLQTGRKVVIMDPKHDWRGALVIVKETPASRTRRVDLEWDKYGVKKGTNDIILVDKTQLRCKRQLISLPPVLSPSQALVPAPLKCLLPVCMHNTF